MGPADLTAAERYRRNAGAVQELLDDPQRAAAEFSHERVGSMPVTS